MNTYDRAIGDTVQIKSFQQIKEDCVSQSASNGIIFKDGCWNPRMEAYCGLTAVIVALHYSSSDRYTLSITNNHYFSENMLIDIEYETIKDSMEFNEGLL